MRMQKLRILIFTLTTTLIWCQENENAENLSNHTTLVIPDVNSTISTEEIVCSRKSTCQYEIPKNYDNLRTKTCLCDAQCSLYNDCCEDSKYYNANSKPEVEFACLKTPFDGYIYMVNKCPSTYKGREEFVKNCQTVDETEVISDVLLSTPVTSTKTDITYRNVFCAFCHNETQHKFWDVYVHYNLVEQNIDIVSINQSTTASNKTVYSAVNYTAILANLTVNRTRRVLVSSTESATYECDIRTNLPNNVTVRRCRPNSNDRECSVCDQLSATNKSCVNSVLSFANIFKVDLKDVHLPKANHCNYVPDSTNKEFFCAIATTKPPVPVAAKLPKGIAHCFFQTPDGKLCLINSYFKEGSEFYYIDNKTVYVYKYKAKFGRREWAPNLIDKKSVYICGTEIPRTDKEKIYAAMNDLITEILIKFSILFLVVYLITNCSKEQLQSLPNKIIFSYCLTLLAVYTVFEVAQWLPTCYIASAILHYLFLSCFAWLLIASYDFWQVICRSSNKLQTLAGKTRLKRYLVYCFLGWISPLSIMAVAIYFELAPNSTIPCPLKPGYGRLKQCFISQLTPSYYFFYYPTTVMFSLIIILFAHTSYHIYLSKRKNIKSTAQNNYYALFAKLALTMGLTWTLGMLVTYTDFLLFRIVYVILNSSQGTFMFFAYGFRSSIITKAYQKHKDSAIAQQTISTFVSISDRIKARRSPQSSTTDPPTQESQH